MSEKREINIQTILDMLNEGKKRSEINEELELNPAEIDFLWGLEELKFKKPKKYTIGIVVTGLSPAPNKAPENNERI